MEGVREVLLEAARRGGGRRGRKVEVDLKEECTVISSALSPLLFVP